MTRSIVSHAIAIAMGAVLGLGVARLSPTSASEEATPPQVAAPAGSAGAGTDAIQTVLFETTMEDIPGRVAMVRELERPPGTGGTPHRHPGSHTFGYVLEGTYEVQVDDGPLRKLGPGETFYEYPGALHAVSRNGSATERVRYLVFTVSDPTLPATVQEQAAR